jgi:hypothetical protein
VVVVELEVGDIYNGQGNGCCLARRAVPIGGEDLVGASAVGQFGQLVGDREQFQVPVGGG